MYSGRVKIFYWEKYCLLFLGKYFQFKKVRKCKYQKEASPRNGLAIFYFVQMFCEQKRIFHWIHFAAIMHVDKLHLKQSHPFQYVYSRNIFIENLYNNKKKIKNTHKCYALLHKFSSRFSTESLETRRKRVDVKR